MGIKQVAYSDSSLANFRHSDTTPQVITERTKFIVDGLLAQGTFNFIGNIWDAANCKITPLKKYDDIELRVSFVPGSDTPTVIDIDIDVNGLIIATDEFQPFSLNGRLVTRSLNFYASPLVMEYGAVIFISASTQTWLTNKSIKIKKTSTLNNN